MKKILAVFAHPDDEVFGPGGTMAKYGHEGVEIHILCATRGESGDEKNLKNNKLGQRREKELLRSAEILGIKSVEFLDFIDGQLCNNIYHQLADKIIKKIKEFNPQVVLTNERLGISGHLDHIAVSMTTTYAYLKTKIAQKLYYYCMNVKFREKALDNYFIYFPEGYQENQITTKINYEKYWDYKKRAMKMHESQLKDVTALLSRFSRQPKIDHFILQYYQNLKPELPETDFFSGVSIK